jgi:TPR repeat protein
MAILVECTACHRRFRAQDRFRGTAVKCPACHQHLTIAGVHLPDHEVFISYSHQDKALADAACAALENRKLRCWMAPRDIVPGMIWGAAIVDAIEDAKVMVILYTAHFNVSQHVLREVELAVSKGVVVVPLRLEAVPMSKGLQYFLATSHWLDALTPPVEEHLARLAETVQGLLGNSQSPARPVAGAPHSAAPAPVTTETVAPHGSRWLRAASIAIIAAIVVGAGSWAVWRHGARTATSAPPVGKEVSAGTVQAEDHVGADAPNEPSDRQTLHDRIMQDYKAFAEWPNDVREFLLSRATPQHINDWQKGVACAIPEAQHLMALAASYGVGVEQDHDRSTKLLKQAVAAGLASAMSDLGAHYYTGEGVVKDFAESAKLFRQSAEAGDPRGMNLTGAMYQYGLGPVQPDPAEALRWYRRGADAGSAIAMYDVGLLYQSGVGVAQDYMEALKWFRKSAEAGNGHGITALANLYTHGWGVPQDYAEALKWYHKAVDAGSRMTGATAMCNIGWQYQQGLGVTQDYAEAMQWYRKAADAGSTLGMVYAGYLYQQGLGVPQDYAETMQWYRKATDAGNATAMNNVGAMYHHGWGVPQDLAEAMKWYRKGADGGDGAAMYNIAGLYASGWGVAKDEAQALTWFAKAARAGHPLAQQELRKRNLSW